MADKDKQCNSVDVVQPVIYHIPFPNTDGNVNVIRGAPCYKDQFPATNISEEISAAHANCIKSNKDQSRPSDRTIHQHRKERNAKSHDRSQADTSICSKRELKIGEVLSAMDNVKDENHVRRTNHRYTEIYKASLRLKGLHIERIFAKNRSQESRKRNLLNGESTGEKIKIVVEDDEQWRTNRLPDVCASRERIAEDVAEKSRRNSSRYPKDDNDGSLSEMSVGAEGQYWRHLQNAEDSSRDLPRHRNTPRDGSNRTESRESCSRIVSRVVERYEETPGRIVKSRDCGRRLGNIVSSERLHQLLNSEQPLRMKNFYNYYPQ